MPEHTQIDYSHLSIEDLFRELKGLRDDLKEAQLRVEQVLYDFQQMENELFSRLEQMTSK